MSIAHCGRTTGISVGAVTILATMGAISDDDVDVYVKPDDDDGGGESRFCSGKWWC